MINSLLSLYTFIDNSHCLFGITLVAFCFKVIILSLLVVKSIQPSKNGRPWIMLAIVTLSATIIDFSWLLHLFLSLTKIKIDYRIALFIMRAAWISVVIQYQALGIFIERIVNNNHRLQLHQKILCGISFMIVSFLLFFAIRDFNCTANEERSIYEMFARNIAGAFGLFATFFSCLVTIKKVKQQPLPRLLKKQLKILIQFMIAPIWLSDFWQIFPLVFSTTWITNSYAAASISTLLITYALFHCMRKVMALRFLNLKNSVETITRFNFIDGFKDILEQLSHATTIHELSHITQNCFKEAFGIPANRTHLYIRSHNEHKSSRHEPFGIVESTAEKFIAGYDEAIEKYIRKAKILTYDEIAFSNFYDCTDEQTIVLKFMDQINADIFIPIYEKEHIIGYIVVDRYARVQEFYGSVEQDEMQVFASYLGNIINLIQNRNLETLIHREKELQEELYDKHQEINQYKESIRSFLTSKKQKDIGIIFFKNRRFSFGNQAAKELINLNINTHHGHPTSKALRTIARHVQEYKTPHALIIKDSKEQRLVLSGVPSVESNTVIITVYHPDISDLIKYQATALRDPSKWDYLLYLETTQSGKLINQLLPGTGETLLQAKISLLKAALSKKAILLEMAPDDLITTVELLHHISLRETLHVLKLQQPVKNYDTAIKLFGINPIFGARKNTTPLLEKLDNTGTLFIQNVQYLDHETQSYLAEYLKYGSWRIFKSEQRMKSNVRVICSTDKHLASLVQDGLFLKELYIELKRHTIIMPSLLTLPEDELFDLSQGYAEQAIGQEEFKDLLELNEKEKKHIFNQRPISFHGLKVKIQHILAQKTRKNNMQNDITFDQAYASGDPNVIQAIRLGKHALRDPKIMNILWNKFKSQTKIASLLGVNRSSVNRRCKDYNLE